MDCERNLGRLEHVARVVVGGLAVLAGLALLTTMSFLLQAAGLVPVLVGFDLTFTGTAGYCPVHGLLHKSTAAPRDDRVSR